MLKNSAKLSLVCSFLLLMVFSTSAKNYSPLLSSLIDLSGWKAEKPKGMSMDMGAMAMTNAGRNYTKGDKTLHAIILIGTAAMMAGQMPATDMNMETEEMKASTKTINKFKVSQSYNKVDKNGAIVISLFTKEATGAYFMLNFDGISTSEALKLAKKFDWKTIKKKAINLK